MVCLVLKAGPGPTVARPNCCVTFVFIADVVYFVVIWLVVLVCAMSVRLTTMIKGSSMHLRSSADNIAGVDARGLVGMEYTEVRAKMRGVEEIFRQSCTEKGCECYAAYWMRRHGAKVRVLRVVFNTTNNKAVSALCCNRHIQSVVSTQHDAADRPAMLRADSSWDKMFALPKYK
jgi:hypothetical protein